MLLSQDELRKNEHYQLQGQHSVPTTLYSKSHCLLSEFLALLKI